METWKKIAVGTVVGGALIGGGYYLMKFNRLSAELETVPTLKIHKLDLTGLTLRVDVQLKNPMNNGFKIKFPFIKLLYKNATIGSSQMLDKDIVIPAFGEAVINQILIKIPTLNLFSVSGSLIKAVQNKEPIKIEVRTLTTIDLGFKQVPYTKSEVLTLPQNKT
jgi:hypothetical protein